MNKITKMLFPKEEEKFILKISFINDMGEVVVRNEFPVIDGCIIAYDCKLNPDIEHISNSLSRAISDVIIAGLDRITKIEFEISRE